jgi:nitronate monooxygenase
MESGSLELVTALNELLEAERAGARVTLHMASEAPEDMKQLIMSIHRDESRWCGVLANAIRRLKGTPSLKTGAFYDKALAIVDFHPRLAFLNRGQAWVVRKLAALLPTVQDQAIRADLEAMLVSHEHNIVLAAAKLQSSNVSPEATSRET